MCFSDWRSQLTAYERLPKASKDSEKCALLNRASFLSLIRKNDRPTRKIVTRKQRLLRLSSLLTNDVKDVCRNCGSDETIVAASDGDLVCAECGIVRDTPIYQELHPFLWGSRGDDAPLTGCDSSPSLSRLVHGGSTYVRYFHFNEILASVTLSGPWICNLDMRLIREKLAARKITSPSKYDVQQTCKEINAELGTHRFSQKYSEKWIQIIFRFNGEKPENLSEEFISSLRRSFRLISACWDDVSSLLNGSRDPCKRKQWPNYFETLYRIIRYTRPEMIPVLQKWIPRLSKRKRKDLKPFFKRLFYLVGWSKK